MRRRHHENVAGARPERSRIRALSSDDRAGAFQRRTGGRALSRLAASGLLADAGHVNAVALLCDGVVVLERLPHGQLRMRDARADEPERWAFCAAVQASDLPAMFEAVACRGMGEPERRVAMDGFPW